MLTEVAEEQLSPVRTRQVLDARVSYLMVSLLQGAITNGTGAGVGACGLKLPAAGKTGTSEPVPPKREEPAEVAADTQGPAEHVILITDNQGRRVYINFGERGSPASAHDLRPDSRLASLSSAGSRPSL